MVDFDIMGAPDAEKVLGIVTRECCRSSFEMDTLYRAHEAMVSLRAEFGQDDSPEFIEENAPPAELPTPLDETAQSLVDLENAIIGAAAKLWQHRIAIARHAGAHAGGETEYRRLCAADGIEPGF